MHMHLIFDNSSIAANNTDGALWSPCLELRRLRYIVIGIGKKSAGSSYQPVVCVRTMTMMIDDEDDDEGVDNGDDDDDYEPTTIN